MVGQRYLHTQGYINALTWTDRLLGFGTVQGYMPSYELYLDGLRNGIFKNYLSSPKKKRQVHVLMDCERKVIEIKEL